jgi:pilus assembly protein CpaF
MDIPSEFLRKFIASAINVIIQVSRMVDGRRKLISLQEITGMEGNVITMQEIFSFHQTRLDSNKRVKGIFKFQGVRPKFIEKFKISDIDVSPDMFDPNRTVEI